MSTHQNIENKQIWLVQFVIRDINIKMVVLRPCFRHVVCCLCYSLLYVVCVVCATEFFIQIKCHSDDI